MKLKLYVVPGSHPCATVEAALALKGLQYERVDLMVGLAPLHQRLAFGKRTVPGLAIDGYRVVGSRLILRTLEGLAPEPPLLPADPVARAAVDEAERWGDDVLQEAMRWIAVAALVRRPDSGRSYLEGANLPAIPDWLLVPVARAFFVLEMRVLGKSEAIVRDELAALPGHLDHVDELIAGGVIGGPQPNVADLQIGSSVRLLLTIEDLAPLADRRPCGDLALRLFPHYPGTVPAGALPLDWIPSGQAVTGNGQPAPATAG